MENLSKLLSVKELSEILGIAEITIRKFCCAKKIPYIKLGGLGKGRARVLFDPAAITSWIEKQSVKPLDSNRR